MPVINENMPEMLNKLLFTYKLWNFVDLNNDQYIKWSDDGDSIYIYVKMFNEYLIQYLNIFAFKNWDSFSSALIEYGFKLVNFKKDPNKGPILEVKNQFFRKNQPELLPEIIILKKATVGSQTFDELKQIYLQTIIEFEVVKHQREINNNNVDASTPLQETLALQETATSTQSVLGNIDMFRPPNDVFYGGYTNEQLNNFFEEHVTNSNANNKILNKPIDETESNKCLNTSNENQINYKQYEDEETNDCKLQIDSFNDTLLEIDIITERIKSKSESILMDLSKKCKENDIDKKEEHNFVRSSEENNLDFMDKFMTNNLSNEALKHHYGDISEPPKYVKDFIAEAEKQHEEFNEYQKTIKSELKNFTKNYKKE